MATLTILPATKSINMPVGYVRKVLMQTRKQFFAFFVPFGIIENAMELIKEYEILLNENDDIPWLCMCSMDEMASKFPFGYLSKFEVNDLYGIDLPSQLELCHLMSSDQNFPRYQIWMVLILRKTMSRQLKSVSKVFVTWIIKLHSFFNICSKSIIQSVVERF